mmetsp:Transcript_16647/g.34172  ORF Transcript_16647/g.34172 Transcript_16647/m.34172 type:complete len:93 (-) Transcript_16647:260-538(-)
MAQYSSLSIWPGSVDRTPHGRGQELKGKPHNLIKDGMKEDPGDVQRDCNDVERRGGENEKCSDEECRRDFPDPRENGCHPSGHVPARLLWIT